MDYPALIAALPAAVVSAVATTPQGLTTSSQAYVSDERRTAVGTVEAWWRPVDGNPSLLEELLDATVVAHEFELEIQKAGGTRAELEAWGTQVRDYFGGAAVPAGITDLVSASVRDLVYDLHPGEGDTVAMRATIAFVGVERR